MRLNSIFCLISKTNNLQFFRTGVVLKRLYEPKLYEKSLTGYYLTRLREESYAYELVYNTISKPAGDIDVILATDVDGLGFEGDVVTVPKKLARGHMLPTRVALYASEENLKKTTDMRERNKDRKRQTESAHRMLKELSGMTVSVPMSSKVKWTLNKTHLKVAFRNVGVELSEDTLTLQEEEITSPGEYQVAVLVNGMNSVKVRALVYHHHKNIQPDLPAVWSRKQEHTFELEEVLAIAAEALHGKGGGL